MTWRPERPDEVSQVLKRVAAWRVGMGGQLRDGMNRLDRKIDLRII